MMKIIHHELRSGLASAIEDILNVEVPDIRVDYTQWGVKELSQTQKDYICNDVVYLNELYLKLLAEMTQEEYLVYERAHRAVIDKTILDVQGYEDLLTHKQEKPGEANKKRIWFEVVKKIK